MEIKTGTERKIKGRKKGAEYRYCQSVLRYINILSSKLPYCVVYYKKEKTRVQVSLLRYLHGHPTPGRLSSLTAGVTPS
jgi:hypothetical protein